MSVPFAIVPVALLTDGRVASLPPASRLLLHEMFLRASLCTERRDRIPLQPGLAYAAAVKFLVGDDTERLDKLIGAGVVVVEDHALRLTLTVAALAQEARQRGREGDPADASPDDPEGPDEALSPRQKPSASKTAMRYRHDAAGFAKRAKGWSRIPRGLSWSAWLQTDDGLGWTTMRERTHPGYTLWVTRVTRVGDTLGVTRGDAGVTPGGDTPSEKTSSSENSEEERREKREGDAGDTPRVTPPKKASPPGGVTPLDMLRDAAGAAASLHGNPDLERGLLDQLTRRKLTDDVLRAMGAALATPGAWWRSKGAPEYATLTDLAGYCDHGVYAWKALDWLVAHASKRARPASLPRTVAAPPPSLAAELQQAARFQREVAERMGKTPKDEASHG